MSLSHPREEVREKPVEAETIRIQSSDSEARRLEDLFRTTDDRKLRDRLQIVLLAHKGRPRQQIADDLAVHRRSVTRWLNACCDAGLDALMPKTPEGKAASIPDALADDVRAWVIGGPVSQGSDRANRTHEDLASHLGKAHGLKTSRSAVQRFCKRIDVRPYRPTCRFLRADPAKQEEAKEDLADLKKSAGGADSPVEPGRGAVPDGADVGPNLDPIERFWKELRRRATHDRLFDTIKGMKASIRASLGYFQTVRSKILSFINSRPKKAAK